MTMDLLKDLFYKVEQVRSMNSQHSEPMINPFEGYRRFMLASSLTAKVIDYQTSIRSKNDFNRKAELIPDILDNFIQICLEENITPEYLYNSYIENLKRNHLSEQL